MSSLCSPLVLVGQPTGSAHRKRRGTRRRTPVVRLQCVAQPHETQTSTDSVDGKHAASEHACTSSRRSLVAGLAGSFPLLCATAGAAPAESLPTSWRIPALASLAPLRVYLDSVRNARKELESIRARVQLVDATGAQLPFAELQNSLQSGALARLRDASLGADQYLGEDKLEGWEEATWDAMPTAKDMWKTDDPTDAKPEVSTLFGRKAPSGVKTFELPAIDRPNDFLCLVFSCFNDPRQPPSTNHLLTLKMLQEGLTMGARGDKRITPEGITSIIDDINDDLDHYLNLAAERQAMFGKLSK